MTAGAAEVVVALLLSGQARPAVPAHWHDDDQRVQRTVAHQDVDERDAVAAECYLPPHDVLVIDQYYNAHARPALSVLLRKLERSSRLPADWERRVEPLPILIERQLVTLPRGARRGLLDGYAVIYRPETETIVDVVALFRVH